MTGLAERLQPGDPVADRILGWQGDPSSNADSVPLRIAGGLHALILTDKARALAAAYASGDDPTDTALAMIRQHPDFLLDWLTSPPQTNEVRRSAPLIAAAHWLTARFGLPLILSELGASAGLNLLWDHYALRSGDQSFGPANPALILTPDWTGPLPTPAPPTILDRRGVDLNPLDPVTDHLRLLAYLWPDQPDRIARTRAAQDLAAQIRPRLTTPTPPTGWKLAFPPRPRTPCTSSSTQWHGSTSRAPRRPAPSPRWPVSEQPPLSPSCRWKPMASAPAQPSP